MKATQALWILLVTHCVVAQIAYYSEQSFNLTCEDIKCKRLNSTSQLCSLSPYRYTYCMQPAACVPATNSCSGTFVQFLLIFRWNRCHQILCFSNINVGESSALSNVLGDYRIYYWIITHLLAAIQATTSQQEFVLSRVHYLYANDDSTSYY
jgi:hypothetical protein